MNRASRWSSLLLVSAAFAAGARSDAATESRDPAARGLDAFVHVPAEAAPGATVPVQIEVFGFPTVTTLAPLAGASVEAAWDPDKLGPHVSSAPPPVRATSDASGRVHLDVPVPEGDARELALLIGVRSGAHRRTRSFPVSRVRPRDVELYVSDRHVVPGGAVSAWVLVTSSTTHEPVAGASVAVSLLEGGFARQAFPLVTDAAGTAMVRVPIPWTDEPSWSWTLRASAAGAVADESPSEADVTLSPREETPGTPSLAIDWAEDGVRAGDAVTFHVRVRDATDQPLAGLPVRYWVGPKGTSAPVDEKAWEKASTAATTDFAGEVAATTQAPETVVQGVGTTLTVVAQTSVEGHALRGEATVRIEAPAATAELLPEAGAIVPGASQRLLLRVLDGRGNPVQATFRVEGDGLAATAPTDASGEAEVTWAPPVDVGALRDVGPCAGGVAAAVIVRWEGDVPALAARRDPFELCLPVDREAPAVVKLERPFVRAGERARVRIEGAKKASAWSVVLRSELGAASASGWLEDGEKGGEIELPRGASGAWTVSAVSPATGKAARVAGGALVVAPSILPKLTATLASGRAAPGGAVDIDVDLRDEKGAGLPGTVAAVMIDRNGGGSVEGLSRLDTRRDLCRAFGVGAERCDRFAEGDPALDPLRRGELGAHARSPLAPSNDPGGQLDETLRAAFADVVRSLEGAVFEATTSPDRLRDVRRKGPNGYTWNPELMTLVTAAMDPKPLTPGGEPLALGDLVAIDPQVSFDNVARRVTRLKLFRILSEMRAFRRERMLDPGEPALRDPNAMLRRLVRDGRLGEDVLLDPWGGTIRFAAASGPPEPFLTFSRTFELRAPGPDGAVGTGDDVRDPFERVLRSGTPYAKAVQEDRIVDAKYDMEVADATVEAWRSLFEELTGTALGESFGAGGIGLVGMGSGGGGRGEGMGVGSGHGRLGMSISTGVAFWSPPRRTDDAGHVRIHVPLGDAETTWRIAFVGVPDRATPATATVDVPVAVPLSSRVDAGAAWIEGDEVDVALAVRNRSTAAAKAELAIAAGGAAVLVDPRDRARSVDLPAGGVAKVTVRVRGKTTGAGWLDVTTRAPGLPDDVLHHEWEVRAAGELQNPFTSKWIDGIEDIALAFAPGAVQRIGKPRLVLERGEARTLSAALESLEPDRLTSADALADAVEVGARVERWATQRDGERSALAVRAGEVERRALGRLGEHHKSPGVAAGRWAAMSRARAYAPVSSADLLGDPAGCPPEGEPTLEAGLEGLDAEPPPSAGVVQACWDAFVASATSRVTESGDAMALARAVLALGDRPHRAASAASLADRLREAVHLDASGAIVLGPGAASDRASRAIVYAALLRATSLGKASVAPAERLSAWSFVQRDVSGGYGSALATREMVRALLSGLLASGKPEKTRVVITTEGFRREVEVGPSDSVVVPIDSASDAVHLETTGPGLLARLERLAVRKWSGPAAPAAGPMHLDVEWPADAHAGRTGLVRLHLRHDLGRGVTVDTRLPLPPGVSLAEPVKDVRQVQGVLAVRTELGASALPATLEIPVRFALSGKVTVPEARARFAFEEGGFTLAPSRPLVVR